MLRVGENSVLDFVWGQVKVGSEVCLWQERPCTAVTCRCIIIWSRKGQVCPAECQEVREYDPVVNTTMLICNSRGPTISQGASRPVASALLVADLKGSRNLASQTAQIQASLT
jgi:hypothetical protein